MSSASRQTRNTILYHVAHVSHPSLALGALRGPGGGEGWETCGGWLSGLFLMPRVSALRGGEGGGWLGPQWLGNGGGLVGITLAGGWDLVVTADSERVLVGRPSLPRGPSWVPAGTRAAR